MKFIKKSFSDDEIILTIKNNSDDLNECFEYLYNNIYKMIFNYVNKNNGNSDDAAEVLQEGIIRFYEAVVDGRFRSDSAINTYIFSIAKNQWINICKKQNRNESIDNVELTSDEPVMYNKEQTHIVMHFMNQLKDDCKLMLTQVFYDQLAMDDIAEKMGFKNAQNARNKKLKCMNFLKNLITDSDYYPELLELIKC